MTANSCYCRELHFNETKCSFVQQSDTQGNLTNKKEISIKNALLMIDGKDR